MKKSKKGVVLLITIFFITTISAIIAYQFSIVKHGIKRVSKEQFYFQSMVILKDMQEKYLKDLTKELQAINNDTNSSDDAMSMLREFYGIALNPIDDEKVGRVLVTINPAFSKFNINKLKYFTAENRFFFQSFIEDTRDPELFLNLIDLVLETNQTIANGSYDYLVYDDTLSINSPSFRKKEIVNFEQFNTILEDYYKKTSDDKMKKLPWREFISFSGQSLQFNDLSSEYCKAIFNQRDKEWKKEYCDNQENIEFKKEDLAVSDDENLTLSLHGIEFASKDFKILVNLDIIQDTTKANFKFIYDINRSLSEDLTVYFD